MLNMGILVGTFKSSYSFRDFPQLLQFCGNYFCSESSFVMSNTGKQQKSGRKRFWDGLVRCKRIQNGYNT